MRIMRMEIVYKKLRGVEGFCDGMIEGQSVFEGGRGWRKARRRRPRRRRKQQVR